MYFFFTFYEKYQCKHYAKYHFMCFNKINNIMKALNNMEVNKWQTVNCALDSLGERETGKKNQNLGAG